MCPLAPIPPPADIGLYWTYEDLFMFLAKIMRGSPIPCNVITDVNPFQFMPANLPDVWFLIGSEEKKDTELGFWKEKGEASDIFTSSVITGWRNTLEFYEGQVPYGRRTDWVMQEYMITQKGLCDNRKPKDSRSLCRVFLSDKQSPHHEMPPKNSGADVATRNHSHSILSNILNAGSTSGQGSTSESQVRNRDNATGPLAVDERLQYPPVENLPEIDYMLEGDFLELDDLADPGSPSSSSDNTSCLTMTSEECFDSLALLQDLEQGKDTSFKCTVSTSVKPKEVVMRPATLGSLIGGNGSKLSAQGTPKCDYSLPGLAIDGKRVDKRVLEKTSRSQQANAGTSNSRNMAASSGTLKSVSEWEKKSVVGRKKKLWKYFCCLPF